MVVLTVVRIILWDLRKVRVELPMDQIHQQVWWASNCGVYYRQTGLWTIFYGPNFDSIRRLPHILNSIYLIMGINGWNL